MSFIDGNVDSLPENPAVPKDVKISPYWGPVKQTPADRRLRGNHGATVQSESDVTDIWWPELKRWLDDSFNKASRGPPAPAG